jgi:peptidyl-prolyl cis-trans isomerase A (cyclophilin A)
MLAKATHKINEETALWTRHERDQRQQYRQPRMRPRHWLQLIALLAVPCTGCVGTDRALLKSSALHQPNAREMNRRAPEIFKVRLETSKGEIVIEVHRDWAPRGADRFYNLVGAGYYDKARFFRVIEGRWAQFGINGDPRVANLWRTNSIPDDPAGQSNVRGTVAFAFAVPNGRTTQVFINLRDNSTTHDREPFVPFGKVVAGMEVADALDAEYGESAGGGIRGGKQEPIFQGGKQYLEEHFPHLDFIKRAVITRQAN